MNVYFYFYFYFYYILPTIIYDYNWEAQHVRLLHLLYNKDGLYRFMKRLQTINNKIIITSAT